MQMRAWTHRHRSPPALISPGSRVVLQVESHRCQDVELPRQPCLCRRLALLGRGLGRAAEVQRDHQQPRPVWLQQPCTVAGGQLLGHRKHVVQQCQPNRRSLRTLGRRAVVGGRQGLDTGDLDGQHRRQRQPRRQQSPPRRPTATAASAAVPGCFRN